jgi:O-antigen/teichoic acid export membrane protein
MVIATAVADAGFFPLVARESARDGDRGGIGLAAVAARKRWPLWVGLVAILQLAGSLGFFPYGLAVGAAAIGAISQSQVDTAFGEFAARSKLAAAALIRLSAATLSLAIAVALTAVFGSTLAAIGGLAAGRLLPAIAVTASRSRTSRRLRWGAALSFGLSSIVISLYVRNDLVLLSLFDQPAEEIARYGIAYAILGAVQLVPASLAFVAFTRFARIDVEPRHNVLLTLRIGYAIGAVLAAAVYLDPARIFAVFGSTYGSDLATVAPLLLLILPISVGQPALSILQARNRERQGLKVLLVTMAINVTANMVLIPTLGVRGAVLGTTAAELVVAMGTLTLLARASLGDARPQAAVGLVVPLTMGLGQMPTWSTSIVLLALAAGAAVPAGKRIGRQNTVTVEG